MKIRFNVKCVMCNLILLYALHFTHYTAFAQAVSSTELINQAKAYDGKELVYCGEVIGDIMARGEYAWLNIHDGKNAIGIWAKKTLIQDIFYGGSYRFQGDALEVSGIFHRACPQHGGDLDIHAETLVKFASGRKISEGLDFNKLKAAILLLGAIVLLWILILLKRK